MVHWHFHRPYWAYTDKTFLGYSLWNVSQIIKARGIKEWEFIDFTFNSEWSLAQHSHLLQVEFSKWSFYERSFRGSSTLPCSTMAIIFILECRDAFLGLWYEPNVHAFRLESSLPERKAMLVMLQLFQVEQTRVSCFVVIHPCEVWQVRAQVKGILEIPLLFSVVCPSKFFGKHAFLFEWNPFLDRALSLDLCTWFHNPCTVCEHHIGIFGCFMYCFWVRGLAKYETCHKCFSGPTGIWSWWTQEEPMFYVETSDTLRFTHRIHNV